MRRFLAVAALTSSFFMVGLITAFAADKGGPVAYEPVKTTPAGLTSAGVIVETKPFAQGLFVEGSVAAANFHVDGIGTESFGLAGLGLGWDHHFGSRLIGGVFARYDFSRSDDMTALHVGGRLGVLLNPQLLLYMPIMYTMDGKDIDVKNGIWSAGVGLETAILVNNLALFGEVTRNFALQGNTVDLDEAVFFRAGVRFRF